MKPLLWMGFVLLLLLPGALQGGTADATDRERLLSDWALQEGFALSIDTTDYHYPSSIAFVSEPGPDPKDPLYFVTELRGKVKVVTNDRTVHTFAEIFAPYVPEVDLPAGPMGQGGMAGVCLEPQRGYVFVTYIYEDEEGLLRNGVTRFETRPGTFSTSPVERTTFNDLFMGETAGVTHQIGNCQVVGDLLYVGIGDGWKPTQSQNLSSTLGKVLRMTVDGQPVPSNPFFAEDGSTPRPTDYVWAYGLRNPFGIRVVEDRVFVAENGVDIDRFLEVRKGRNYLWNGTDRSLAMNADFVFSPALSPVQTDFLSVGSGLFPEEFEGHFFIALASDLARGDEPGSRPKGILHFGYDFERNEISSVPDLIVQLRGPGYGSIAATAFGPDGLYFAPVYRNEKGESVIYRIHYDPDNPHPYSTRDPEGHGFNVMDRYGCFGCHSMYGQGSTIGPNLDRGELTARLHERLHSPDYLRSLEELQRLERASSDTARQARAEVLASEGRRRLQIWTRYKILEPDFENPRSQMSPAVGISDHEVELIVDALIGGGPRPWWRDMARSLPEPRKRHLVATFAFGLVLGGFAVSALGLLWSRRRRRG